MVICWVRITVLGPYEEEGVREVCGASRARGVGGRGGCGGLIWEEQGGRRVVQLETFCLCLTLQPPFPFVIAIYIHYSLVGET